MKCDCARFTWAGWTPEFKEELKKGKRGWSPPESESGLKEREGKNEMNLDYAIEKFHNAVHVLATSPAALKTRLLYAFLSFHTIEAPDLPPELRDDFEWVENALTRLPEEIKGEGMVKATLRRMKEEEAIEVAQRIARIYDGLVKPWERRWSGEEE